MGLWSASSALKTAACARLQLTLTINLRPKSVQIFFSVVVGTGLQVSWESCRFLSFLQYWYWTPGLVYALPLGCIPSPLFTFNFEIVSLRRTGWSLTYSEIQSGLKLAILLPQTPMSPEFTSPHHQSWFRYFSSIIKTTTATTN